MKFKSSLISSAAGSVGGSTYARNRFGMYIRQKSMPVNPMTSRQVAVRSIMSQLTVAWSQTLTAAQRTAWNSYGSNVQMTDKLGDPIYLTGFNHYLRSNIPILQAGGTRVDDGPSIFELPEADPTLEITASESTQVISVTFDNTLAWANETGGYMVMYQGQPQNPQRNFFGGPWRYGGKADGDDTTPPTSPNPIIAPFTIAESQKQWLYARIIRADGRISQTFRADAIISS